MKKLVLTAAAIFATVNIFAQGTVNFSNIGGLGGITNSMTGARVVAGATFQVQLYYAPDTGAGVPDFNGLMPLPGVANIAPTAGLFSGGTRTAPVSPPGTFAYFQVRAWETAFGTSYEDVLAKGVVVGGRTGLAGFSNIIRVNTADPTLTPAEAPSPLTGVTGLQGFLVVPVPEPSVIGLGLLGAGALLMLRRRK
jgi:hypothetical protein